VFKFSIKRKKNKREQQWLSLKNIYTSGWQSMLFEIIINYYFHTILLEASVGKKRIQKASTRGSRIIYYTYW
jgi:hypothetical protein